MKDLAATMFYACATVFLCGLLVFVILSNTVGDGRITVDYRIEYREYQAIFDTKEQADRFVRFVESCDTGTVLNLSFE